MRRVLVSGGSRGIGAAIVETFTACGDTVVFLYKSRDDAAKALSERTGAVGIKADVSDSESVNAAVSKAVEIMGGIDVLVSNAGISFVAQICDTTDLDWISVVNSNLSGSFYLAREVSKIMVRSHSGKIINVGSVWGKCGASCESAYSASKAGLRGLTMSLAKELGPSGITVNCIEPGIIDTDMNKCFDRETLDSIAEEIPAGRLGSAQEIAYLAEFLASHKADYINGQCIAVDGGWCI